jgi:hypothetical protein
MNERIKELAEQAGMHDFVLEAMGIGEEFEKFAELIVRECIAQCWTVSELESNGYVVSECSKKIRKHFGVEE